MSTLHTVSDAAGLMTALRNAGTDDVIVLGAGTYGQLTLKGQAGLDMDFAGGVTIRAADAGTAVLTGLDLRGAANLTFEGIAFDYMPAAGDPDWQRPFSIRDSRNISINSSVFDGHGNGYGLSVTGSAGVTLADSQLQNFVRGAIFSDSTDLRITGNDIAGMRSDGLNFGGVQGVRVADNHIHDFNSPPGGDDHPDMIQIWTRGTDAPSTGITITGNTLDIGDGTPAQSIFIRNDLVDRGLAGEEMFYRDITITQNVIVNAQTHGITVGETDGLVIANNSVLHADGGTDDGADASVEIPRIRVAEGAVNVTVTDNLSAGISGANQPGWTVAGNVVVQDQDPQAAGYYADVFLSSSLTPTGPHEFLLVPGGDAAQSGAGASASYAGFAGDDGQFLTAQFAVRGDDDNGALRIFDASGTPTGTDLTYHWDFGDGATAVGAVVAHAYAGGGRYQAVLTVSDDTGGASTSATSTVTITGPDVLGMQADGRFITYDAGQPQVLAGMGQGDSGGLYLGAAGVTAAVDRSHISEVLTADEFAIGFTLEGAPAGAAGEVMRLHGSFLTQVTASGEMVLYTWDAGGDMTKLKTTGAGLGDGAVHDIALTLADDVLALVVDGVAVTAEMDDTLASKGKLDLMFGNPWGKDNFAGSLRDFTVTVDAGDYSVGRVPEDAESFDAGAMDHGLRVVPVDDFLF